MLTKVSYYNDQINYCSYSTVHAVELDAVSSSTT